MIKKESEALRKLKEERSRRNLEELNRDFSRILGHLDEIGKLGDEAFRRRSETVEAARTKPPAKPAEATEVKPNRRKKK